MRQIGRHVGGKQAAKRPEQKKDDGVANRKERPNFNAFEESFMKIVKGWKRIDNQRGYINAATGQNLVVTKKQYGEHYLALLFPRIRNDDKGKKVSPEFSTESKAQSFAMDWMKKHPRGQDELHALSSEQRQHS